MEDGPVKTKTDKGISTVQMEPLVDFAGPSYFSILVNGNSTHYLKDSRANSAQLIYSLPLKS